MGIVALLILFGVINPRTRGLVSGVGVAMILLALLAGGAFLWWKFRSWPKLGLPVAEGVLRVIPMDNAGIEAALQSSRGLERLGKVDLKSGGRASLTHHALPTAQISRALSERLRAIDWFQFEKLMEAAFSKTGYRVERRGGAHADDGIDLIIEKGGERIAIQCKHWHKWKVSPKTVREMLGAMTAGGFKQGKILALGGFTDQGYAKAVEYGIGAWGERDILKLLEFVDAEFDPGMIALLDDQRKFCPKCEAEMVLRTAKKGASSGDEFWGCSRYPACNQTLQVNAPAEAEEEPEKPSMRIRKSQ